MSGPNRQPPSGQDYLPNGQRQGPGDWGHGQGDQRPRNQQNSQQDIINRLGDRVVNDPDIRRAAQGMMDGCLPGHETRVQNFDRLMNSEINGAARALGVPSPSARQVDAIKNHVIDSYFEGVNPVCPATPTAPRPRVR